MTEQPLYPALINEALSTVRYPGSGKNIVELGMVEDDLRIDGRNVSFSLIFSKSTDPFIKSIVKSAETAIHTFAAPDAVVTVTVKTPAPAAPVETPPALPGVRNIIAVSSGKGGVGKSTVAANLAVSLAAEGYSVGLLDADIFGPSVPKMFDIESEQLYMHEVDGRNLIIPVERYGVKLLSIGLVIDPDKAAVWRGSMASNALKQLIEQADWGELDYFLIDMPPGTSDIHLTLVQTLGITGALVVTTPQQVALADARKGIAMFRDPKINVPVLGLVDNMAWFTPEKHPDERYYIFGNDESVDRLAADYEVPVLTRIPLVATVGDHNDAGSPVALDENSLTARAFRHLAREVIDAVDTRNNMLPPTVRVDVSKK
ncbi:MAG: Mrp/NBP35 family ATP-binding protein [Muribaculaceae bacterium]|nr:Mrp/NBP35 family ATP-binding protein [Muribaculaceae bacterium]